MLPGTRSASPGTRRALFTGRVGLITAPDLPYGELVVPFASTGLWLGSLLTPVTRLAIGVAPPDLAVLRERRPDQP